MENCNGTPACGCGSCWDRLWEEHEDEIVKNLDFDTLKSLLSHGGLSLCSWNN